jgi:hypothetical protein
MDPGLWTPERLKMEKPEYLPTAMGNVGFKDCTVEVHKVYAWYPGEEGMKYAMEALPGFYSSMMKFQEGEKEKWLEYWKEELINGCVVDGGIKISMTGNIGWGTK